MKNEEWWIYKFINFIDFILMEINVIQIFIIFFIAYILTISIIWNHFLIRMGDGVDRPLTKIEKNNRAFAIVWLVLQFFFCFMYGFYARTTTYSIYATNGNQ